MNTVVLSQVARAKVTQDGKVVVLLLLRTSEGGVEKVRKYCLQDDGSWEPVLEGECCKPLNEVFIERKDI